MTTLLVANPSRTARCSDVVASNGAANHNP